MNTQAASDTGDAFLQFALYGDKEYFRHLDDVIESTTSEVQSILVDNDFSALLLSDDVGAKAALANEVLTITEAKLASQRFRSSNDKAFALRSIIDEIVGLGPIEPLWRGANITEIMVNGPDDIWVEVAGRLIPATGVRFRTKKQLEILCAKIVSVVNRQLSMQNPTVDARLKDGSRVNIVDPSIAPDGPFLTIRRFPEVNRTIVDLVKLNSVTPDMSELLVKLVENKATTLVSGGTGSGKALATTTPILTTEGFKALGDVGVGDFVFTPSGYPTRVEVATDVEVDKTCFEVVFSTGDVIVADAEHLWAVKPLPSDYEVDVDEDVRTVFQHYFADYAPDETISIQDVAYALGGDEESFLPLQQVLEAKSIYPVYQDEESMLYTKHQLDALFGDCDEILLTTQQLVDIMGTADYPLELVDTSPIKGIAVDSTFQGGSFSSEAELMGAIHIDYEVRTELGANTLGGFVHKGGMFTFDGSVEHVGRLGSLFASLNWSYDLKSLAFEQQQISVSPRVPRTVSIKEIRETDSVPVRCIRVADESHMFLAGTGLIPTHNTTLLNALSSAIPKDERIITIEDSLELRFDPNAQVLAMESRPADANNSNEISIKRLVKNALRMRPNRIIVGEVRDEAALDMLEACNTGHEGSMSTLHANGPNEAIARLAVMVARGGEFPESKVDWLISSAVDIIVQVKRYTDGSRRVSGVYEVPDITNDDYAQEGSYLKTIPLWEWERTGTNEQGMYTGEYVKKNDISVPLAEKLELKFAKKRTWDDIQEEFGTNQ